MSLVLTDRNSQMSTNRSSQGKASKLSMMSNGRNKLSNLRNPSKVSIAESKASRKTGQ